MRSLAKLTFSSKNNNLIIPPGAIWWTATAGEAARNGNDWSIRITRVGEIDYDHNTMIAKIDFLVPAAEYLHKPGTHFQLWGSKFLCDVEVIEPVSSIDDSV